MLTSIQYSYLVSTTKFLQCIYQSCTVKQDAWYCPIVTKNNICILCAISAFNLYCQFLHLTFFIVVHFYTLPSLIAIFLCLSLTPQDSYPQTRPVWFSDSEDPVLSTVIQRLSEISASGQLVSPIM